MANISDRYVLVNHNWGTALMNACDTFKKKQFVKKLEKKFMRQNRLNLSQKEFFESAF